MQLDVNGTGLSISEDTVNNTDASDSSSGSSSSSGGADSSSGSSDSYSEESSSGQMSQNHQGNMPNGYYKNSEEYGLMKSKFFI